MSLDDIDGIGKKTILNLKEANIDSVEKLANSSINDLKKIKGIGEKSAKKFINNAKNLLSHASNTVMEQKSYLKIDDSLIRGFQSNLMNINKELESLKYRLNVIEQKIGVEYRQESEVSEEHFFRKLKLSYNSLEKKIGGFVLISDLTEKIKNFIPLSTEEIHKKLYSLFLNYKVELQPGKSDQGVPLEQDGKKFVWFKLK
ncbi:MAG: helix-hairpin-helix domain-containing protein [Promethearchaeota archaeon]